MRRCKRTQVLPRAALGFGMVSGGLSEFTSQARADLAFAAAFNDTITHVIDASVGSMTLFSLCRSNSAA
jgi:hypothetical protein